MENQTALKPQTYGVLFPPQVLPNSEPCPAVVGRWEDDSTDPRFETKSVAHAHATSSGDDGGCEVRIFWSLDDEDRGGVVIEFGEHDANGGFKPHSVQTADGCQVHLAGDGEGGSLLVALHAALADLHSRGLLDPRKRVDSVTLHREPR